MRNEEVAARFLHTLNICDCDCFVNPQVLVLKQRSCDIG